MPALTGKADPVNERLVGLLLHCGGPVLKPGQYQHLLRVTEAISRDPARDILVLLLGIHVGMRVSEIAQIEVGDGLFSSGAIRQEVSLRAPITKGCRQRCIYPTNRMLIQAIDRYLSHRIKLRWRMSDDPKKNEGPDVIGIAYKPHADVGRFSTPICI